MLTQADKLEAKAKASKTTYIRLNTRRMIIPIHVEMNYNSTITEINHRKTIIFNRETVTMKITTQCRLIRTLLLLCVCLQILYFVLTWGHISPHLGPVVMHFTAKGLTLNDMQRMNTLQWAVGFLFALPAVLVMLYSLWKLDCLLATLGSAQSQKSIFSIGNIGQLRSFAGGLALSTLLSIAEEPARGSIFSLLPGEHMNRVSCSVNTEEIILLLACMVFYLVTGMMHEGRRLAEENEGFI